MWEVWQYCAAPLAVLQYEEAGRRYPGTGRTGHEYSSTDTWPYHSVSPCQVWQYGADFLMYPSIASHLWRTDTLYPTWPCPLNETTERRADAVGAMVLAFIGLCCARSSLVAAECARALGAAAATPKRSTRRCVLGVCSRWCAERGGAWGRGEVEDTPPLPKIKRDFQ